MALRSLFPHQVNALTYAANRSRIALFMEMRLGKTTVAIRWAKHHQLERVLVVAPLSVLPGWIDELRAEGVPMGYINFLTGNTKLRVQVASEIDTGWALINYEAVRAAPQILDLAWSGIILDESTRVRNPKAQTTKFMIRRTGHIGHRAILSGLPAPESPMDYFCQMQFLHGHFMNCMNFWVFRQTFFQLGRTGWDWEPKPDTVTRVKHEVHRQAFVLTRKGANMGERKIYERRVVPMTKEQNKAYQQVMKTFKFEDIETVWAVTRQLWLARIAGGFSPDQEHPRLISDTKLAELMTILTEELPNEPVVVWYRFNEELHATSLLLFDAKIPHKCITGETTVEQRRAAVADFQAGRFNVLLMQINCGKFGLNTSRASTAIYYSNSYELEARAQSEDRIVHMAKQEPLLYIDLVTGGTVDEAVVEALRDKKLTAKQFMNRILTDLRMQWEMMHARGTLTKKPAVYLQANRTRWNRVFPKDRRF